MFLVGIVSCNSQRVVVGGNQIDIRMQCYQTVEKRKGRFVGPIRFARIDDLYVGVVRNHIVESSASFECGRGFLDAQHFNHLAVTIETVRSKLTASDAYVPVVDRNASGVVGACGFAVDEDDGDAGGSSFVNDGAQCFGCFGKDHNQIDLGFD